MPSRLEDWLERLGAYIVQHGWCDPFGVSIVPDAGQLHDDDRGWTGSIEPVADGFVPIE